METTRSRPLLLLRCTLLPPLSSSSATPLFLPCPPSLPRPYSSPSSSSATPLFLPRPPSAVTSSPLNRVPWIPHLSRPPRRASAPPHQVSLYPLSSHYPPSSSSSSACPERLANTSVVAFLVSGLHLRGSTPVRDPYLPFASAVLASQHAGV
jgi:hypothetical protein